MERDDPRRKRTDGGKIARGSATHLARDVARDDARGGTAAREQRVGEPIEVEMARRVRSAPLHSDKEPPCGRERRRVSARPSRASTSDQMTDIT